MPFWARKKGRASPDWRVTLFGPDVVRPHSCPAKLYLTIDNGLLERSGDLQGKSSDIRDLRYTNYYLHYCINVRRDVYR